jgi:hypothetical protein
MAKAIPSKPPRQTAPHAYVLTRTSRVPGRAVDSRAARGPAVRDEDDAVRDLPEGDLVVD